LVLIEEVFKPLGNKLIRQNEWTEEERKEKISRFADNSFKFLYYSIITFWGWTLIRSTPWCPPILGGSGETKNAWLDYPFQESIPYIKEYYLVQLGYHVHNLLTLVGTPRKSDFMEMTLHHICAVVLIWFSYMVNFIRIGTLVFLLHDIGDIIVYLGKATADTYYTKFTATLLVLLSFIWFSTRLFIFPGWIIYSTMIEGTQVVHNEDHHHGYYFFNFILCLLLILHTYWFGLLLKIGIRMMIYGEKKEDLSKNSTETSTTTFVTAGGQ